MGESRLGKSRRNIIAGLVQHALNLFLVWLGRFIFVRVLSADYLGINGLFANVLTLLLPTSEFRLRWHIRYINRSPKATQK